MLIRKIRN